MIRANTRGRLTAADLQLVILLLSRGSAHRRAYLEQRLASEGPDSLLDSPDLLERLLTVRSMLLPSEALFFYVLVRHALRRSGLEEREFRPTAPKTTVGVALQSTERRGSTAAGGGPPAQSAEPRR